MLDDTSYGHGGGGGDDNHKLPPVSMINSIIDAAYKAFASNGMCLSCSIEMLTAVMFARHNATRQHHLRSKYNYDDDQVDSDIDRQLVVMIELYEEAYELYKNNPIGIGNRNGGPSKYTN